MNYKDYILCYHNSIIIKVLFKVNFFFSLKGTGNQNDKHYLLYRLPSYIKILKHENIIFSYSSILLKSISLATDKKNP